MPVYWPWVRFPHRRAARPASCGPSAGLGRWRRLRTTLYWKHRAEPGRHSPALDQRPRPVAGARRAISHFPRTGQIEGAYHATTDGGSGDADAASLGFETRKSRWYVDYRHSGRFTITAAYDLRYDAGGTSFWGGSAVCSAATRQAAQRLARLNHRSERWKRARGFSASTIPARPQQTLLSVAQPERQA
ncbi:hypothetical protein DSL92_05795 [Billgrantia gudaonensis]|uniref:Uncharacterized protein n=1 Tax=Billgrantia gudaonensis TaxID=376427 RepID=A0A3S0NER3_9GAMM|nr:hypothetical protein DSL92_05795 [Halomonas gudaonensis]